VTTRISVAEYRSMVLDTVPDPKNKLRKYRSQPVVVDGIRFDSKREAKAWADLMALKRTGEITMVLRQVPFHLPGGTIYRTDFLAFYADGTFRVLDAKGVETATFKIKKREVEAVYPIKIETI
jgi:hypothetical protein